MTDIVSLLSLYIYIIGSMIVAYIIASMIFEFRERTRRR